MPIMKIINGHCSTYGAFKYLFFDKKTGERRALAVDGINVCGETWLELSHEMEDMRNWYDDESYLARYATGDRKKITYKHFIISPDPEDEISLLEFRNFMIDYLDYAFENRFQIGIIYHSDNGILHAHCIVNSVDLDEPKRLSTYCTNKKMREIQKLLQQMAYEKGWHNFLKQDEVDLSANHFDELGLLKIPKDFEKTQEPLRTKKNVWITSQDAHYTKIEREILDAGGWSWKEDIRIKCRIAAALSLTESDYINTLKKLGIKTSTNDKGDYIYTHPDRETWNVTGYKLGYRFSRRGIRSNLINEISDIKKPIEEVIRGEKIIENSKEFFESMDIDLKSIEIIHTDKAVNCTLKEVAHMLEINENYDIKNKNDYKILLDEATFSKQTIKDIKDAQATANKLYSQFFINNKKINLQSKIKTPEITLDDKLNFANLSLDESVKYLEQLEQRMKQTGSKAITEQAMQERKTGKKAGTKKKATKQQIQQWKSKEKKQEQSKNKKER